MDKKQVFISYKAEEFDQAVAVKKHLESYGISCWMAPMSIQGGSSYAAAIPKAIQESKIFVLILSEKAQESKWVPREVDQAINCGKVIMPYMLENCPLRNDFSFYLTNVQRYDAFRDPEETLDRMTRDIMKMLGIKPPVKEEPREVQPEVEIPQPKQPKPKKEKKPAGKKKKVLPWILGGVLAGVALLVGLILLLLPDKVIIAGVEFEADDYSVQLEDVTLSQLDVDRFLEFDQLGSVRLSNCVLEAEDLSPITENPLFTLSVQNCGITTEQFATLGFSADHRIEYLYLNGNPELTDVACIAACEEKLTELDISDTGITDFDWLESFVNLQVLRANRTGLCDTTVLESMIYLQELGLSGNGVTSLEGLSNTSKLSVVDLSHNDLADVSLLSRSAACLKVVHLENNDLTDLSCLSGAEALTKVYVDENALTDLNWLRNRTNLQTLSAGKNQITDINGLGIGGKLNYVNLSDNKLQTIGSGDLLIADENYVMVDLRNNQLTNVQLPENCTYKQLVLLGNPDLQLSSLNSLEGWNLYMDFPVDVSLQTLKDLPFNYLCLVGCPLARQVEIEEGLGNERLMTQEEVLEEIAEKALDADY